MIEHDDNPALDEFTTPHIAFAAAEHFAVTPQATKAELIALLRRDAENRYAREITNHDGFKAALLAIEDADRRGLLEPIFRGS